jgi:hypothetical protein
MNNISGNAGGWTGGQVAETDSTLATEKVEVSYAEDLVALRVLHSVILAKYEQYKNKDIGDALVSLEMAIKSLKN